jgi:hypothetical protein
MRAWLTAALLLTLAGSAAMAQERRGIRFWNLTAHTVKELYLSPAGRNEWGPNQCKNDRDGEVDHDERLRITGIEPGRYDARLADAQGRVCVVRGIDIAAGAVFAIEEKQLTECTTR